MSKKILSHACALIMLLLLIATAAIGCSRIEPLPMRGEDGSFAYQVIRPDVSGDAVMTASIDVRNAMRDIYAVEPVIGTDWIHPTSGKADYPEIATEVLVGKTNRAESQQVWEELGEHEYTVRVVNQKIVILGKTALDALDDYLAQKKSGKNPVFKAASIGLKQKTDFWN